MASKLFGGANLSDIARSVKERAEPSPFDKPGSARPVVPAAELALTGRVTPELERENIFAVDPKRVRPWKYHNRTEAWYTRERCQDLIDSIAKDEQQEPALARQRPRRPELRLRAHLWHAPPVRLRAPREETQAPGHRGR